jgi:DNA-binding transcriptional regulator YiaG
VPVSEYTSAKIADLRQQLGMSQPVFAAALNVSSETVKKWEQGARSPDGAASLLLEIAERNPSVIIDRVQLNSIASDAGWHNKRERSRRSR